MKRLVLILLILNLAGCAHVVSKDLRAEAETEVNVSELFEHPELYSEKTVILGGEVIQTVNLEEVTELEVLEKPLDSRGRPRDTDISRGRFIVTHPGQLDPAIFEPGREITAVATVSGFEKRPLGETEYQYLKLNSKAIYIHKGTASTRKPRIHFGIGVYHGF